MEKHFNTPNSSVSAPANSLRTLQIIYREIFNHGILYLINILFSSKQSMLNEGSNRYIVVISSPEKCSFRAICCDGD